MLDTKKGKVPRYPGAEVSREKKKLTADLTPFLKKN